MKSLLIFLFVGLLGFTSPGHAKTILILGDSISAAYGMDVEDGWVKLLEQKLVNTEHTIINASISGDTTGMGLSRLPRLLEEHQPNIVVIELGGNDGLRGYPIRTMRNNFTQMIELSRGADAKVLLAAIQIPPNYGNRYASEFINLFEQLKEEYNLAFVPFILEGIPQFPELMQDDGIHPKAEAQHIILENVWPHLERLLSSHD